MPYYCTLYNSITPYRQRKYYLYTGRLCRSSEDSDEMVQMMCHWLTDLWYAEKFHLRPFSLGSCSPFIVFLWINYLLIKLLLLLCIIIIFWRGGSFHLGQSVLGSCFLDVTNELPGGERMYVWCMLYSGRRTFKRESHSCVLFSPRILFLFFFIIWILTTTRVQNGHIIGQ